VHDPEKNVPSTPINGEINGNALPAKPAAACAIAVSISGISPLPRPEKTIICTIATLAIIAIAAARTCFSDARKTPKISRNPKPKHNPEITATGKNGITPGLFKRLQSKFPGKKPFSIKMRPADDNISRNGKNSSRVITKIAAIAAYGNHAFTTETLSPPDSRVPAATDFSEPRAKAESASKRQTCFGTKKPARTHPITIGNPTTTPSIDGNSGPKYFAVKYHGTVYASPANKQNGTASKIDRKRRSREVVTTKNATAISGKTVPAEAKIPAVCSTTAAMNTPGSVPAADNASESVFPTVNAGVPAAPNGTGIELQINANATAATAGKPSPTKSGAVNAAAAPNPAAPSIKPLKSHAKITVCTRLSSEILENEPLITTKAPLFSKTFSKRIAPKIISTISSALSVPKTDAPAISSGDISQTENPTPAAAASATDIEIGGETRNAPIKIIAAKIGIKASTANILRRGKNADSNPPRVPAK